MDIEIIEPEGPLAQQRWRFTVFATGGGHIRIRLESWRKETRPTTRHRNWQTEGEGYRSRSNNGHHTSGWQLPAAQVPFPEAVRTKVLEKLLGQVEFEGAIDPPNKTY